MLHDMIKKYLSHLSLYSSKGMYKFTYEHSNVLLAYFGNVDPGEITKDKVIQYMVDSQARGLSNNTINKRVQLLKRIFKFNNENPTSDLFTIKKLKEEFITFGRVSDDDVNKVLDILDKAPLIHKTVFYLLKDTGVRVNELIHIRLANVNLITRMIELTETKNKKSRIVFMSKDTAKLVKKYIEKRKSDSPYLLINKYGHSMTRDNVRAVFTYIKRKCDIHKISPHMIRHTLSSQMYNNSVDLLLIMSILGHSSADVTKRYIHQDIDRNLNVFDQFIKSQKK